MPRVPNREVMIATERSVVVSAYVNRQSAAAIDFPSAGIDGVEIRKQYLKGHTGKNGNPGIAASVTRHSPSLDPSRNFVLLVSLRDEASLLLGIRHSDVNT